MTVNIYPDQVTLAPEEIEEIFQMACQFHQESELNQAIPLYEGLITHIPDSPLLHYNLGLACFESGDYQQALKAYRQAEKLAPDDGDILFNLGLCLKNCGQLNEAIECYLRLLQNQPDDADVHYNLGLCLQVTHALEQAATCYEHALAIDQDHVSALTNLPYLYHRLGQLSKAQEIYDRLLKIRPDHPSAQYMLAILKNESVPMAPPEYLAETFDAYAETFEESLVDTLQYRVPELLREHYDLLSFQPKDRQRGIDLGCGTGLAGKLFAPLCTHLSGIDISAKMVAQAEKKDVYDRLIVGEIILYLARETTHYDLFVAADVLSYLGDLEPIFTATAQAATPGAIFCCSTEAGEQDNYTLNSTGRFAHSANYIRTTAKEQGWQLNRMITAPIRHEGGQRLMGYICFFTRE